MPDIHLTPDVRRLNAEDLGIVWRADDEEQTAGTQLAQIRLPEHDETYQTTLRLLQRFGGVIFAGPPGTGKTRMAELIAERIAEGHESRVRVVQFHPSYSYEQFMEGFVPNEEGVGFTPHNGHFVQLCNDARRLGTPHVLVIDELSRADVGLVFGEALTYVDKSKRGKEFSLASGAPLVVPENLIVLATMNPFDKGVDGVDAAFERRFARIDLEPQAAVARKFLTDNGAPPHLVQNVLAWFKAINDKAKDDTPTAAIGHSYFEHASDEHSLRDVWNHQLKHRIDRAFRHDKISRQAFYAQWESIFVPPSESSASPTSNGGDYDGERTAEAGPEGADSQLPAQDQMTAPQNSPVGSGDLGTD